MDKTSNITYLFEAKNFSISYFKIHSGIINVRQKLKFSFHSFPNLYQRNLKSRIKNIQQLHLIKKYIILIIKIIASNK